MHTSSFPLGWLTQVFKLQIMHLSSPNISSHRKMTAQAINEQELS